MSSHKSRLRWTLTEYPLLNLVIDSLVHPEVQVCFGFFWGSFAMYQFNWHIGKKKNSETLDTHPNRIVHSLYRIIEEILPFHPPM
jgi:hypothetical protein